MERGWGCGIFDVSSLTFLSLPPVGEKKKRTARVQGPASALLKRMVPVITWVGLVVSPTLFGWWIKGLGVVSAEESDGKP